MPGAEQLEVRNLLSTFTETEPNGTFATANVVAVPMGDILTTTAANWLTIHAAIASPADSDYFQFTLITAAGVFFDIDSREIGLSTILDSVVEVFDAAQISVGSNNDGYDFEGFAAPANSTNNATSRDSSLYLDLAAGTYYVRTIANALGTGNYQLRMLADLQYSSSVPILNSLASSLDTLYLDFDGHASTTDPWPNYSAGAFDFDGDPLLYSPGERLAIKNAWRVIAEDFSPFKINVSTVDPTFILNFTSFRQIMTSSPPSIINKDDGVLGTAFIGSYAGGTSSNNVAFTFAGNFPTYSGGISGRIMASALEMGNTTSHEFGHALGLEHFNTDAPPTTFAGNASQIPNAIMATPEDGPNREIWASGQADEDGVSTFFQDDVATISNATNTFGYRNDDNTGTSISTAQALVANGDIYTASGVIERLTDVDFFGFIGSGNTTIRVDVDEYVNNLDVELRLYDSAGNLLFTADLSTSFDAVLTQTLAPGTYYAEIRSDQQTGEMGQYTLQFSTTVLANRAPTRTASAATLDSIAEDTSAPVGDSVANLFGSLFADLDGSTIATGGVAIVAKPATSAQGTWQVKVGPGAFSNLPALNDSTAALVLKATDLIRFVPALNFNGIPGSLTARLWDGTGQIAASATAQNISPSIGGAGAFSDNANLVSLGTTITAINDAPTRTSASAALAAVAEDATDLPGNSVSNLLGGLFADVDGTAIAAGGAAIIASAATLHQGTWQVKVGAGDFVSLPSVLDSTDVVLLGAGDFVRFLPALDYHGTPGELTVRLWDGTGDFVASATAQNISASIGGAGGFSSNVNQVTLSTSVTAVNDAPAGADDTLPAVSEDAGAQSIAFAALVGNDLQGPADEGGQQLTITVVSGAVGGTVEIVSGEVIFTPTDDYNGPAGFTYALRDDGQTSGADDFLSSTAVASFTITAVNDAPLGVNDPLASAAEDSGVRAIAFAELLGNDLVGADDERDQLLTIEAVSSAVGGTVEIVGDEVIFTAADDYSGPAGFSYTLRDDGQTNGQDDFQTATAEASFTITPVNDAPSGVNDPLPDVDEDSGAQTIAFAVLLGNDAQDPSDENGQTLTLAAVGGAVGGTVEIVAGEVIFTPADDYNGLASFSYTVRDDGQTNGADDFQMSTALASFAIEAINDRPSFTAGLDQSAADEQFGKAAASVITFDALTGVTGKLLTPYLEDGFRVVPVTGRWAQANIPVLGHPIPAIFSDAAMGTLEVTRPAGGFFSFTGFELASRDDEAPIDPVSYTVEGLRGAQTVFSATGNVGTGQFANIASPSSAFIDTLRFTMQRLNSQAYLIDNISLIAAPSKVIVDWATMLAAGPAGATDEAGQALSFAVTNDNNDLFIDQPAVDAFGTLTYSPKPNVRGAAQVTVTIRDNGGGDNGGSDTSEAKSFLIEVTKPRPRHNIVRRLDVTADGFVVAEDALAVINTLNAFGARELPAGGSAGPEYYDTTGDNHLAADDALDVINHLNAFGPDGEGESAGLQGEDLSAADDSPLHAAANALMMDDLTALLAIDAALQPKRRR